MYLLDTNVISELRKAHTGKADANVLAWSTSVKPTSLYLSAITIMELEQGILTIERKDASQGKMLREWFMTQVLPVFAGRILPVDAGVAMRCARLHVPDKKSEADALIGATALENGLTLVTRNVADFKDMGVTLLNPWEPAAQQDPPPRKPRLKIYR